MSNLLAVKFPHLRDEFMYCIGKDGKIDETRTFNTVSARSNYYAMWKCSKTNCEKKCEHIYRALISNRTHKRIPTGCPFCDGRKVCVCNSFAEKQPELAKTWGENGDLKPWQIAEKSGKMIQWKCDKHLTCNRDHVWSAPPYSRIDHGCPYCFNNKVCFCNSFESKQPELSKEWGDNGDLKPSEISEKSGKMIRWKCNTSLCNHHIWMNSPASRVTNKSGCPFCSGRYNCECYCLASEHPELLNTEWDESKNDEEGLDIFALAPGSERYAWWKCCDCQFSWYAIIANRTRFGRGCPKCSSSKMEKSMRNVLNRMIEAKDLIIGFDCERRLFPTKLFADFYITTNNDEKIIVEMDGQQHFVPVAFGSGSRTKQEMFAEVQKNDQRKKEWCEKNNIRLLRISYLVDPEHYETELLEFINNKNVAFRLVGKPIKL